MSRPACLRTLKGLSLAAMATVALLMLPVALTWGSKSRVPSSLQDKLDQIDYRKTKQLTRVTAVERAGDLSPFGPGFKEDKSEKTPQEKRHQVETAIGWVDLRHPENGVLRRVPATLRADEAGLRDAGPRGRGQAHGVNIVQVDENAMRTRGFEAIESDIRQHARILDEIPERAFVVRVANEKDFDALTALPFVEAIGPYHPAFKVSPQTGRIPLIQASRAHAHDIDLIVSLWADADSAQTRGALESIAGKDKVSPWSADGTVFQVKGSPQTAARLAKEPGVRSLGERPEFMLTNSETPTLMMIGNTESAFGMARPYHDVGLDGGGIDADISGVPDGRRINNDT